MSIVRLKCFYHPCPAESKPFLVSRVVLFIWPLLVAIRSSRIFWPRHFKTAGAYHIEWDGWLVECDTIPNKQRVFYGLCPQHAKELLSLINKGEGLLLLGTPRI